MNETTELIEKINALPSSDVFINRDLDPLAVFPAWFTTDDLKSLAAELALANKKIELLQASNDHYADENNWDVAILEKAVASRRTPTVEVAFISYDRNNGKITGLEKVKYQRVTAGR